MILVTLGIRFGSDSEIRFSTNARRLCDALPLLTSLHLRSSYDALVLLPPTLTRLRLCADEMDPTVECAVEACWARLLQLTSLTDLGLHMCGRLPEHAAWNWTETRMTRLASALTGLTSLALTSDCAHVEAMPDFPLLAELECSIESRFVHPVVFSPHLRRLRSLRLHMHAPDPPTGIDIFLGPLRGCSDLVSLALINPFYPKMRAVCLSEPPGLPRLQSLTLRGDCVSDAHHIGHLHSPLNVLYPALESLTVDASFPSKVKSGERDVRAPMFAELAKLSALRTLTFRESADSHTGSDGLFRSARDCDALLGAPTRTLPRLGSIRIARNLDVWRGARAAIEARGVEFRSVNLRRIESWSEMD